MDSWSTSPAKLQSLMQDFEVGVHSKFGVGIEKLNAPSIPCFLKRGTLTDGSGGGGIPRGQKKFEHFRLYKEKI